MKRWIAALVCALLVLLSALALAEVPQDALAHIGHAYPEAEIEDYLALPGLPDGDYGFALVRENGVRTLLGFRWRDGQMENWLDSGTAVPQTDRKASFYRYAAGTSVQYIWDQENEYGYCSEGFNLGVNIPDEWNETIESSVYYEWESGAFRLRSYRNHFWDVDVFGDTFYFWDIGNGLRNVIDTDVPRNWNIRSVDFEKLPTKADDLAQRAHNPPQIPRTYEGDKAALWAQTYRFAPDKKYPVYNGPGEQYRRAGNGKASVSTNGWIQVFGEHDGWLMIQYAISDTQCRIGWIPREALAAGQYAETLEFAENDLCTLSEPCVLTDDPLCSRSALCEVPKNARAQRLARLGYAWAYVRVTVDGENRWGFVPDDLLEGGETR